MKKEEADLLRAEGITDFVWHLMMVRKMSLNGKSTFTIDDIYHAKNMFFKEKYSVVVEDKKCDP